VVRSRNAEARRYTARRLSEWSSAVDAHPVAGPDELAVLVKALLTGLAMQRRLDPGSVDDDLAVRGLAALLGLPVARHQDPDPARPVPPSTPAVPAATAGPAAPSSSTAPTPQGATP
jgi:hypothetical protein